MQAYASYTQDIQYFCQSIKFSLLLQTNRTQDNEELLEPLNIIRTMLNLYPVDVTA
jgi:hypothetical protein